MSTVFKSTLLAMIDPHRKYALLAEHQLTQLVNRYRVRDTAAKGEFRVNFGMFYKDIQYCSKGIPVAMIWAINLANDIVKAKIVYDYPTFEQLFMKYSRMKDIMAYEEFAVCMKDMRLHEEHTEEEFQGFYNYIQGGEAVQNNLNRLAHQ